MFQLALMVGLAVEVYLLLGDLSPKDLQRNPGSEAVPIAELVTKQNTVRVQNEGELVWDETRDGQTLYKRQSVLTMEKSRAEVAFLDGTGISIDEKSLVLLERPATDGADSQRIIVRLLHGTLHRSAVGKSAKSAPLEIQSGDSRIIVKPSTELSITASPESPSGARVEVRSGEAEISSPRGQLSLKSGETASIPKAGAPESRKLPFILLSPSGGQALQALSEKQTVRFRWRARPEVVSGALQEIEVSRDPQFSSGVIRSRIASAEPPLEYVEINLDLAAPSDLELWHWRVKTAGTTQNVTSSVERFWMHPKAREAKRQLAAPLKSLPSGSNELPPPPSELDEAEITPAPRHTRLYQKILELLIPSAHAEEPESWTVKLKWREVKGVKKYRIQIARDRSFKNVVSEAETEVSEWNWPYKRGMENTKGRAFYRVASVSESGKPGAYSKPKVINIPKAETYAATEGDTSGPISPTDAADGGDLHTLAAPAPKPVAAAKPKPAPKAPPAPTPVVVAPSQQSVATVPAAAEAPQKIWTLKATLSTGVGALSQTSDETNIKSVSTQSPYLQQKAGFSLESARWLARAQLALVGFSAGDSQSAEQQPFKAYSFHLAALMGRGENYAESLGGWSFHYGAALDRSFRWLKSGPQSVDSAGALSLGPSAQVVRTYDGGSFFAFREAGAALSLPLTGLFTDGQAGLQGWFWAEWNLASFDQSKGATWLDAIRVRLEAETAYLRWSTPDSTSTLAWSFWLAPALCF